MADHVNCREIRVHVIWKFWRKYLDWAGNIRCHMKICLSKILFLWSLIDNKELNWCIFAQRGNVFCICICVKHFQKSIYFEKAIYCYILWLLFCPIFPPGSWAEQKILRGGSKEIFLPQEKKYFHLKRKYICAKK